jgi:benzylsuccinate CoA-transferase BbsE subunit
MNSPAVQPYFGIRIIDIANELGSYATRLFADLGAEVIRIEPPGGRADRHADVMATGATPEPASASFLFLGVNKKSVLLDLGTEAGRGILRELIASAQIVVYEADADREDMLRLITAVPGERVVSVVSHFGLTGPYASFLGCDLVDQALGGIAWLSGKAGEPPLRVAGGQSGIVTSIYAAIATSAALWELETRGVGHLLDISAQEAIAHSLQNTVQMYDIAGKVTLRGGDARDAMEGIFACKDGFVFLAAPPFMGDQWNQIIIWMQQEGFAEHARLCDPEWGRRELRTGNELRAEFKNIFERFLADKPRARIADESIARKILIAPVSSVADLVDDRQLSYRNFLSSLAHLGIPIPFPGAPYRLSEDVWQLREPPPAPGAHNDRYAAFSPVRGLADAQPEKP